MANATIGRAPAKEFIFEWVGKDRQGKELRGEMRATGEAQVQASLRRQGIFMTKLKKRALRAGKKIKPKDIAVFTRQMATMMKAGVPLLQAFDIVGRGNPNPSVTKLLNDIRQDVQYPVLPCPCRHINDTHYHKYQQHHRKCCRRQERIQILASSLASLYSPCLYIFKTEQRHRQYDHIQYDQQRYYQWHKRNLPLWTPCQQIHVRQQKWYDRIYPSLYDLHPRHPPSVYFVKLNHSFHHTAHSFHHTAHSFHRALPAGFD